MAESKEPILYNKLKLDISLSIIFVVIYCIIIIQFLITPVPFKSNNKQKRSSKIKTV